MARSDCEKVSIGFTVGMFAVVLTRDGSIVVRRWGLRGGRQRSMKSI